MTPDTQTGPIEEWAVKYKDDHDGMRARITDIRNFCKFSEVTVEELLAEAEKSRQGGSRASIKTKIVSYLQHLRQEGYGEGSMKTMFSHIRSFFMWHDLFINPSIWTTQSTLPDYEDTTKVKLTQAKVMRMIDVAKKPQHKAVIAFLAQTGQREAIVTALKWDHVTPAMKGSHAIVTVENPYPDRKGVNVNKIRSPFRFVVGSEAFELMNQLPKQDGGWVFNISSRQLLRVVEEAADGIGIQRVKQRRKSFNGKKGEWHKIHPHTLRGYWMGQMRKGQADKEVADYMMGHKVPYGGTYERFSNRELLANYRKAERYLTVLRE